MVESVPIIDHVGIAVNSLEGAIPLYAALLGQEPAGEETIPSESVRVAFFGEGAGRVELLEPTSSASPIARFIARRGPGLHHICLRVADLDAALRYAAETGAVAIPPGPRTGAAGTRVAFLHPKSTHGLLIELVEVSAEADPDE
jgi:methylmalonyl-CoA/ethylmalonyl-CoA epimerase